MDYDLDQYDNKRLLELLSQTFQNWKRLEKLCLEKEGVYIRQNDNRYNGQTLRDTYICLLK